MGVIRAGQALGELEAHGAQTGMFHSACYPPKECVSEKKKEKEGKRNLDVHGEGRMRGCGVRGTAVHTAGLLAGSRWGGSPRSGPLE